MAVFAAPGTFTFAPGSEAPPLDLSLDEIIKLNKKKAPNKAKPAKLGKAGKARGVRGVCRRGAIADKEGTSQGNKPAAGADKNALLKGLLVKGKAKRQARACTCVHADARLPRV